MAEKSTRVVVGIVVIMLALILAPYILSMFMQAATAVKDAFNGSVVVGEISNGNETSSISVDVGGVMSAVMIIAGVAVLLIIILKALGE